MFLVLRILRLPYLECPKCFIKEYRYCFVELRMIHMLVEKMILIHPLCLLDEIDPYKLSSNYLRFFFTKNVKQTKKGCEIVGSEDVGAFFY